MKKIIWFGLMTLAFSPLMVHADETATSESGNQATVSETLSSEGQTDSEQIQNSAQESTDENQETDQSATSETTADENQEPVDSEAVIASIQAETGTQNVNEINTLADEPSSLRSALTQGITEGSVTAFTQEQLDQLTDEELTNGNRLALRYSSDAMGFDIAYLAKIIGALFVDQTLSWEAIEPQLAFDANSYASFADLIPVVDQLQEYLRVVYPADGVFLHLNQAVSNEWMISILTNLNQMEQEMQVDPGAFVPGRISYIIQAANDSMYLPTGTQTSTTEEATATSTSAQETATTTSSKEANATADGEKTLPKTNEAPSYTLLIAGVILLLIVFLILWRRKKK